MGLQFGKNTGVVVTPMTEPISGHKRQHACEAAVRENGRQHACVVAHAPILVVCFVLYFSDFRREIRTLGSRKTFPFGSKATILLKIEIYVVAISLL
nr:hypothetical protein Iba_chr10bCG5260 [Ipomoea batatas]